MKKLLARFTPAQIALLALASLAVLFVLVIMALPNAVPASPVPVAPQPAAASDALPWAEVETAGVPAVSNEGGQSGLWPVVATILVLGVIYACLWGYKTVIGRGQATAAAAGRQVQLQSSVRLGAQQALHVVRFGPELLLVGASAGGLVVLARQPAGSGDAEMDNHVASGAFQQLFSKALEDARGKV